MVTIAGIAGVLTLASIVVVKPWFAFKVVMVLATPCVIALGLLYLAAWLELGPLSFG